MIPHPPYTAITNLTKMKNHVSLLLVYLACFCALAGCSKDDTDLLKNDMGSTLEVKDGYRVSTFRIDNPGSRIAADAQQISAWFLSLSDGTEYAFNGTLIEAAEKLVCQIRIPTGEGLPNSDYQMEVFLQDGSKANTGYTVTVKDEMISQVHGSKAVYDLPGRGTEDHPYKIASTDAFMHFMFQLQEDPEHAGGYYFEQTADFARPSQGQSSDGRGFINCDFAGTYKGNGHWITISYAGGDNAHKDNKVGLFGTLLDGSAVSNLKINGTLGSVVDSVGLVAAAATGAVSLTNITVTGSLSASGNYAGGLVGRASDATLKIENPSLVNMMINNIGQYTGGLIGSCDNTQLILSKMSSDNLNHIFGKNYTGGIAGHIKGTFSVSNVVFKHSVSAQDGDVEILKGDKYTGGAFGYCELTANSTFTATEIRMPVQGGDYTGGMIGSLASSSYAVTFDYCTVNKDCFRIKGNSRVGGYIGYCEANVTFSGANGNTMSADVAGSQNVGGIVGELRMIGCQFLFSSLVKQDGNVDCISYSPAENIGGVFGWLEGSGDGSKYSLSDAKLAINPNIKVQGKRNVGGIAGTAKHIGLSGNTSIVFDKTTAVSSASYYGNNIFPGKINESNSSASYVGGIIGYGTGVTLQNLYVRATVYGGTGVGGIAGCLGGSYMGDVISECVNVAGGDEVGGLVGNVYSNSYNNLVNLSPVTGSDKVGGIFGRMDGQVSVSKAVNRGTVSGRFNVGGIAGCGGQDQKITFTDCINLANVSASDAYDSGVGGILGLCYQKAHIMSCVNRGTISLTGSSSSRYAAVGGIAGSLGEKAASMNSSNDVLVELCCNFGSVSTINTGNENLIGGVVGYMKEGYRDQMRMLNNYNQGSVSGKGTYDSGGLVGRMSNANTCSYAFNSGKVSNGNGGLGSHPGGASTATDYVYVEKGTGDDWNAKYFDYSDRNYKSTYKNFDFSYTWDIGNSYPYLRNCYFQDAK